MKTTHTPGPWTLKSDPFHFDTLSSIVGGETKGESMRFPSHELHVEIGGFADFKRQEANARLIAAAPELLDALQFAMLERACNAGDAILSGDEWREFAIKARAAIAKATGDAP